MGLFFILFLKNYVFLAVLGLHCCMQACSSCSKWGLISCCPHKLQGMRAQEFRCTGLTALQHVESSWSSVSCFGRWILNRWTTREIPLSYVLITCSKHGVADLRTAPSDLRSRPFPCQHGLILYLGTHWPCRRQPCPFPGGCRKQDLDYNWMLGVCVAESLVLLGPQFFFFFFLIWEVKILPPPSPTNISKFSWNLYS